MNRYILFIRKKINNTLKSLALLFCFFIDSFYTTTFSIIRIESWVKLAVGEGPITKAKIASKDKEKILLNGLVS